MATEGQAETWYLRGENGVVGGHDLPLGEGIEERLAKGHLQRVNKDGSAWAPLAGEQQEPKKPAVNASKGDWVAWVVHAHGVKPDDAEAATKQDLIDTYGRDE